MRKNFLIVLLLFIICSIAMTEEISEADSKIVHVIVYPEWAYVTRKTNISIPNGNVKVAFKHLPSWIDPESIQVKVDSKGEYKIIGANTKTVYLKKITEDEVQKVKLDLTALKDKMQDYKTELDVLKEEKKYLMGLAKWQINKSQFDKNTGEIDVKELTTLDSYIKNALLENLKETNKINRKIRDFYPEINAMEKKWNDMKSRANLEEKEIIVEIESNNGGNLELYVSYLISGASWYPRYDARKKSGNNKIDILYEAVIQQSTGENWEGAEFTLSTIKPHLIKQKPELNPWYVTPENIPTAKNGFSRGDNEKQYNRLKKIQDNQIEQMKNSDFIDEESFDNYQYNKYKAEEVIKQAEERGTTVEFMIPGIYTVKTDGLPVKVLIGNASLETENKYSAIPVVSKSTYVTSTIKNSSEFPFLPGEAKVYKNGNFIGKSKINFVASKEKFELYMGLEERIKVSRILNAQKSSTNFLGSKKSLRVGYNIEVQNFLDEKITIDIKDQIPVSQNDAIKIKVIEIDPKISADEKGVITWNVELNPMEKSTLYFEFEIEYPSNIYLENANEIERQLNNLY